MSAMNRMFAAVVPPESVLDHLDEFLSVRREAAPFRWTLPEQIHLTLAFAEHAPERCVEEWVERLETTAGRRTPFEAVVAGGGAFPNVAEGRVLYAGLDLDDRAREQLDLLAAGARAAATKSGVEIDGARFRPHLTLARMRPTELTNWVRLLDAYRGPVWTVDTVTLVESHLGEGPGGRPRYETVAEVPLG